MVRVHPHATLRRRFSRHDFQLPKYPASPVTCRNVMNPASRGLFFYGVLWYISKLCFGIFIHITYICRQLNSISDMSNFPPNGNNPFNQPSAPAPNQPNQFGQPSAPQPQQLTHYKKLANTNFLGAWDMPDGGADLFLTIANVVKENIPNGKGKKEDCVVVHWVQIGWKPMILNATNRKNLHKATGTPYVEYWRGKTVALYIDHNVRNPDGGAMIDGLRIRNKLPQ